MRNKVVTKDFYLNKLGFTEIGDYGDYLMVRKDNVEIHFFEFKALDPNENYGQVYIRTNDIETLHDSLIKNEVRIHTNGQLATKPWGMKEFALLDPDNNLLTFGQNAQ